MKLIIFLSVWGSVFSIQPTVKTEQGEVIGTYYTLPNGRIINAFLGIPYATPPIHKYRFKEPHPLKPWTGTWNASTVPSSCIQYFHPTYTITGEEDCLYLNLFTPKLPEKGVSQLLDVMVYIHGGAFMFGAGVQVFPDYLLEDHDFVFVSMNYRLGAFGFLSTGDNVVPGNNGLKDQVAALKWVHHNVVKFGGNPASVTIAGFSAGAASVHYHFLSPLSEGLFQKGILFSGSVFPPWTMPKNNTEKSVYLASLVGCPTSVSRDMVKCLYRRPAKQIVEAAKYFQSWRYSPFTVFGPVVEPAGVQDAFLTEEPIQMLSSGRVKDLPLLTGFCKNEGLYPAADFISDERLLRELDESWNEIAPDLLMYNYSVSSEAEKNHVSAAIRKYYFGSDPISNETVSKIIQVLGDRLFYNGITRAVMLHSSVVREKVFCFLFNYRGKYSLTNAFTQNLVDYGVSHGDDQSYILKFLPYNVKETESDASMVKFMTSVIYNFIKTGNPAGTNLQWEPLSKTENDIFRCMNIQSPDQQEMRVFSNTPEVEFWKNILLSEYAEKFAATTKDEL